MADDQEVRATQPQYPLASVLGGAIRGGAENLKGIAQSAGTGPIDRATKFIASESAGMGMRWRTS